MKRTRHIAICLVLLAGLTASISGCTVKATTKTTTDTMTNFFSSTSGHSWFTEDGLAKRDLKVQAFVAMNFDNLQQDMARGEGEYLTSFGTLLGVPDDQFGEFSKLARENYTVWIPSAKATPSTMLTAVSRELSGNPSLRNPSR